jgi:hypothetical protein
MNNVVRTLPRVFVCVCVYLCVRARVRAFCVLVCEWREMLRFAKLTLKIS